MSKSIEDVGPHFTKSDELLESIAISLKRIADTVEKQNRAKDPQPGQPMPGIWVTQSPVPEQT